MCLKHGGLTAVSLKSVLMDKSIGKTFIINGNEVIASMNFAPGTSDSSVNLEFTFTVSAFWARS